MKKLKSKFKIGDKVLIMGEVVGKDNNGELMIDVYNPRNKTHTDIWVEPDAIVEKVKKI